MPLLSEAAKAANGNLSIDSRKGIGTKVKAEFQFSHIDRKPIGDMAQTVMTLVMGNPEVELIYTHIKDNCKCHLDTREIKTRLGDKPINSPDGIRILKENLKEIQMKLKGEKK